MRKLILIFLCLWVPHFGFAQSYIITAPNGLNIRQTPSLEGEKIGKLPFGIEAQLIEDTGRALKIEDRGKQVTANWFRITWRNYPDIYASTDTGYVFSGYLKEKKLFIEEIETEMKNSPELENYSLFTENQPFVLRGDFYGDEILDWAILIEDQLGIRKLAIINRQAKQNRSVFIFGKADDPFELDDYGWIGVFRRVNPGETLWANWDDSKGEEEARRELSDVPENEQVHLVYHAIFVHVAEACGGGFIFWKNGKFHWLQQE